MSALLEKSITHASDCHKAAVRAFAALQNSEMFPEYQANWALFLDAADSVFVKLSEGCRKLPVSQKWYAQEKKARKEDPMLQWIHQARAAEKHSLGESISFVPGTIEAKMLPGDKFFHEASVTFQHGQPRVESYTDWSEIPEDRKTVVYATAKLLTVTNSQYGDEFQPPTSHLGKEIEQNVATVCQLSLTYLDALIWRAVDLRNSMRPVYG